jgi:ABC-type branched-subunit amino acid transport system ATPase component
MAFLGSNGAGKTSTIDMILGRSRPDAGAVQVYGMAPRQAVRKGLVAAVMQTGGLLKDLTVAETVARSPKCWTGRASPRSPQGREMLGRRTAAAAVRDGADSGRGGSAGPGAVGCQRQRRVPPGRAPGKP